MLGSRKDSRTKYSGKISIKESKYNEAGYLFDLFYFWNTSPGIILNLVHYWTGNNIMAGVDSIHSGINLQ